MARPAVLSLLLTALVASSAAAAVQQPRLQYATALAGTDAFVGIAKRSNCAKAYVTDGTTTGATLSVWLEGCLGPEGYLSASRGGVSIEAYVTRRGAAGTVTLRDGRSIPFAAQSGDGGGIVGRRFTHDGRRYRSGWVILRDNQVRWRITPIGRGLYGEPPPPPLADTCAAARAERELLRAQSGPMSHQSGVWEWRMNLGRGPTGAQYNRLNQARAALEERIWALDQRLYDCG